MIRVASPEEPGEALGLFSSTEGDLSKNETAGVYSDALYLVLMSVDSVLTWSRIGASA